MLRTLYQVRQNLPRYIQRSFDKRNAEFQVFSYGYDEDEYVDEFGDNCTKWFECYTTTQFEFDFLEFNAATIHIIALYLSEQQQDLADGDVVTVVMKTPEQFGKKKSLIAKFVPGHQLFQRTEVFCIPGTKFFVRSELKERYNVSLFTNYICFRPRRRLLPRSNGGGRRGGGNTRLYPRRVLRIHTRRLTIFRIKTSFILNIFGARGRNAPGSPTHLTSIKIFYKCQVWNSKE
ncbi:hypothetical protein TVAG_111940 [Trichomonas vaginalis G3]|uniref:Uncharacterized protein n=1 Tax=Trichomonas vaginalis (strain ATCC PRA-98 / G3) TaxID=412133 RepID=A2G4F7_TRIV3|nr:hypothetical protein TVAG_111940 [Trichomonas vaginalis G3]|eukprot:XP_001300890.1 hypothetical protein [Trichomonas vaginalis G3]